jgi:ankyrin repeat protein
MAQRLGKPGLKPAEGIKAEKPKFHKPKTEGIKLSPEKQKQLNCRLLDAVGKGNPMPIRSLIKKGADVNATDESGRTALMLAACGHTITCEILIKKGADVDFKDRDGRTALMFAAVTSQDNIAKMLIENGADVNAKDIYNMTALMLAEESKPPHYNRVVDLLKQAGAKE